MNTLGLAIGAGMTTMLGAVLVLFGLLRRPIRLAEALAALDGTEAPATPVRGLEAMGARFHGFLKLPLSERQEELLRRAGRTVDDFFAEKLVLALSGLLLPLLWLACWTALGRTASPLPLVASPLLALGGYFLADLRLQQHAQELDQVTAESIHTFFDLVVLERLANASGAQAMANAAGIASSPLFRRIATGLEQARLEQTSPWRELHRIAADWNLPELDDFVDVMRLEEQGAGLADTLLARVAELREAHTIRLKAQAQKDAESLTIWMTIPALTLGLAFITPPLLALMLS